MKITEFGDEKYTKKKERWKIFRVILQIVILAALACLLALALFTFKHYKSFQERPEVPVSGDHGFIALSYFGVARTGTEALIAKDRLQEHLQALKANGYETITQQDIVDYYENGDELPQKALFLAFEEGRCDTAIFAQKLLEDLNYKGTALTYAEKFAQKDTKFLKPAELKDMADNSFWELGTNGYRLAFINCYDRNDNYLGELTPLQHVLVSPYMGRKYNHYLMDYMRDANGYPKESYNMMQDRISYDYEKLKDIYGQELGTVPRAHILMHSNTGAFGNNPEVSAVNEKWITDTFDMNFNREGYSWNNRKSSIYDLTRMQPQPFWYVNHLLMRIAHDQDQPITFVTGDEVEAEKWVKQAGAAEFKDEKIIVTSEPFKKGRIFLKNMRSNADMQVKVRLTGNKYGTQSIYLRANEKLTKALAVKLSQNMLFVRENGKELLRLDLDRFDGKEPISVDQDRKAAEVAELRTMARYAHTKDQAEIYAQRMLAREAKEAATIEDGSPEYKKQLSIHEASKRELDIFLRGNLLRLMVDVIEVGGPITVETRGRGKIALEAGFENWAWSQRNLSDDVYDGVFEQLMVYDYRTDVRRSPIIDFEIYGHRLTLYNPFDETHGTVLYDSRLQGVKGVLHTMAVYWDKLLHIFVHTF